MVHDRADSYQSGDVDLVAYLQKLHSSFLDVVAVGPSSIDASSEPSPLADFLHLPAQQHRRHCYRRCIMPDARLEGGNCNLK
jgi:hypothetical protein